MEFVEKIAKSGKCRPDALKGIKSACRRDSEVCQTVVESLIEYLKKTDKIEAKVALFEALDMLFLRSNNVRLHVLEHFSEIRFTHFSSLFL